MRTVLSIKKASLREEYLYFRKSMYKAYNIHIHIYLQSIKAITFKHAFPNVLPCTRSKDQYVEEHPNTLQLPKKAVLGHELHVMRATRR